jgi:hypothetical protein
MQQSISIKAVGSANSLLIAIAFVLCVGLSVVYPKHQMGPALQMWLPGFVWLTVPSFVLGLIESYAYGWIIAGIWVPLYNFFAHRSVEESRLGRKDAVVEGLKR